MRKVCITLSLVLLLAVLPTMVFTGCSKENTGPGSSKATAGNGSGINATMNSTTKVEEPRVKMTMFMGNSGNPHPDGVDPSDNPWINIVEDYANVDLELEVPGYQDFKTKLELMLSSGTLPDIVHSWYPDSMYKFADQGAFIDLKSYYDKSNGNMKKYITPTMMEVSKSPSGHYFRIPQAENLLPQGSGVIARWDLVKKYNNNKWPTSVDEWLAVFRAMHKAEPDSVVLTNRVVGTHGISYAGVPIYAWYGAVPYDTRYNCSTGKVENTFVLPEYKAATEVMREMYKEGILDKEFATNDTAKYLDNVNNKNAIVNYNSANQIMPKYQVNNRLGKDDPKRAEWEMLMAPPLMVYPSELEDPVYSQPFSGSGISGHGVYISSKCKDPERAWKVIEGFAGDELYEAIFWGKEGQEYTVKDGQRIPDAEKLNDKSRYWSIHLALIFGAGAGMDSGKAIGEVGCGKEYSDMVWDSINIVDKLARKNGVAPTTFCTISENASKKFAEAENFITQATVEAIVGKITMGQFDSRVKEYKDKYGFIADEATKYIAANKADLVSKGVILDR